MNLRFRISVTNGVQARLKTSIILFRENGQIEQCISHATHGGNDNAHAAVFIGQKNPGHTSKTLRIREAATTKFMNFPVLIRHLPQGPVPKTVNDNGTLGRSRLFYEKPVSGGEKVVGRVGIEPTTGRLKAECSTSELTPHLGTWMAGMPSECAA